MLRPKFTALFQPAPNQGIARELVANTLVFGAAFDCQFDRVFPEAPAMKRLPILCILPNITDFRHATFGTGFAEY